MEQLNIFNHTGDPYQLTDHPDPVRPKYEPKVFLNVCGHKWYVDGVSSLGNNYLRLTRISIQSDLKRYGQVATTIDYHKDNLTEKQVELTNKKGG